MNVSSPVLQIAIDGPVGAGKSDISAKLAKKLGIVYLYTGAMYRALAYGLEQNNIQYTDKDRVMDYLNAHVIELVSSDPLSSRSFAVLLDGEDVTDRLFQPDIDIAASNVSTLPEVRQFMVKRQQELAVGKSVVMEGRDIGIRVLPQAQLKIYLTASPEERATRRLELAKSKGKDAEYDTILQEIRTRDTQDMTRATDPLSKLDDAWELDTTGMSQEQVVQTIVEELKKRNIV